MRAQKLPAAAGWRWAMAGFAIYRRNPMVLSMLLSAYWLTLIFLNLVPFLGVLLASMAVPGLSAGLMQAARCVDRGEQPRLQTLFGSLRDNPRTLCLLGLLYLLCSLGALGVSTLADGGTFLSLMLNGKQEGGDLPEEADLLMPALLLMLTMMPVLMAYWFAPVLAAWHKLSVGKALFFSFVACQMNWQAFLVYGLALFIFSALLPGICMGLLMLILPGGAGVSTIAMLLVMLAIAPAVYASFYATYRDIFGISEIV